MNSRYTNIMKIFKNFTVGSLQQVDLHKIDDELPDFEEDSPILDTNRIIFDRYSDTELREKKAALEKEAFELSSYCKLNQEVISTLMTICQR